MYRCTRRQVMTGLALWTCLPAALAQEKVNRSFPADALRGTITLTSASQAVLGKQTVGLAPGLRIRGTDNMLVLSGAVMGQKLTVHYTVDFMGQIKDLWILRPDELARWWPRTREEAIGRTFDPVAQTWSQP